MMNSCGNKIPGEMIDLKNINDNIISNRWIERYLKQSDEIKERLDKLDNSDPSEYQLRVIKRKRIYPEIGDIFKINPIKDLYFHGVVLNNHIYNINGDDLLLVLIFKQDIDIKNSIGDGVREDELLIPPQIVGQEYWSRGYFYNIDRYDEPPHIEDYGFYSVGKSKFFDEYGKELFDLPRLLGTFGVATISGIAKKINQELIISGII